MILDDAMILEEIKPDAKQQKYPQTA